MTSRRALQGVIVVSLSVHHLTGCTNDPGTGKVEQQQSEPLRQAADISLQYLGEHAKVYGVNSTRDLKVHTIVEDTKTSIRHARVRQMLDGIPVFGADAVVHVGADGKVLGVSDGVVRGLKVRTRPLINEQQALRLAAREAACTKCLDDRPRAALHILRHLAKDHLTYKVDLRVMEGKRRTALPVVFVDAEDGSVVWQYDNLQTCSGVSLYDGSVSFDSYARSPSQFFLEDLGRKVGTFDWRNGTTLYPIDDGDDLWGDPSQSVAVSAQWAATKVFDYYRDVHGRLGLDGMGGPVDRRSQDGVTQLFTSGVHFANGYNNAFWDGYMVTYGDGDGIRYSPLVSLDICGHEMTHAVVEHSAGLIYSGESGALNEATADIMGAMAELHARGGVESAATWLLGEDAYTPATAGDALRYLDDPHRADNRGLTVDDDPDHYSERYTGYADNGGVHTNSGIANKAFYLMAKGGSHHLTPGMAIDSVEAPPGSNHRALGADKAARIWYSALTGYWTSSTTLQQAAGGLFDAAEALYGTDSPEARTVKAAWTMVGLPVDRTAPAVSITAPVAGATVSGTVSVIAEVSDDVGVTAVELYLDGAVGPIVTSAPFEFSWSTGVVGDGPHTLVVKAYDAAGNVGTSAEVSVTVANDPVLPTATITSPVEGGSVSGAVPIVATLTGDVATLGLLVDGSLKMNDSSSPFELVWNTADFANGPHWLQAVVTDSAGRVGFSAPVNVVVNNPYAAEYDPVLKVPKCATVDSACDSKDLLVGRGRVGPELNAPNTIGSTCSDGASGAFHADESLDRLRISTLDGSPLSGGKTVKIEATVWAWGYQYEYLDLFYAADANNPSWKLIATLKATANGAQVLSTTYVLPLTGLQAIRGNWRYLGSPGACTTGAYDDRDDLVFAASGADATPPTVNITSPATPNNYFAGATAWVIGNASDPAGIALIELLVDGTVVNSGTTSPFSLSWNTTLYSEGTHQLTARARDWAGNVATSAPVSVLVDNRPPTVAITDPMCGRVAHGVIPVTVAAADAVQLTNVELLIDGTVAYSTAGTPFTYQWNTATRADGTHSLVARARDGYGRLATSMTVSVTIDNVAHTPVITTPAGNSVMRGLVAVEAIVPDGNGVVGMDLLVDGVVKGTAASSPYVFSLDAASLADGVRYLQARARDGLGGTMTSASVPVIVDNAGPLVQLNETGGRSVTGTVAIHGIASDAVGVVLVELLVDGTVVASGTASPFTLSWDTSLNPDGAHFLTARATDRGGNVATSLPIYMLVDHTAPSVTLSGPSGIGRGTLPITVVFSDAMTQSPMELRFDGAVVAITATSPYTYAWNSATASDGAHQFEARASDAAGNATTKSLTVTIDNTLPVATITAPSVGSIVRGTVTVEASATDAMLSSVDLLVDGAVVATDGFEPFSFPLATGALSDGSHQLQVRARDTAGNLGTSTSVSIVVDNSAPAVAITSPGNGAVVGTNLTVSGPALDSAGVSAIELLLDGGVVASGTTSPFSFALSTLPWSEGGHNLVVRATDSTGNVGSSAGVQVIIDHTGPTALVSTSPSGLAGGVVAITVDGSDANGVTGVSLLIDDVLVATGSAVPLTYSWNSASVFDGTHKLEGRVTDRAGMSVASITALITDNTPPVASISAPAAGTVVRGAVAIDASATDPLLDSVELLVDGFVWATDGAAPFSFSLATAGLVDGFHELQVRARDSVGNAGTSAALSMVVDNTAPSVSVSSPASGGRAVGNVAVTAAAGDATSGVASVGFLLDGVLQSTVTGSPYAWTWNSSAAAEGPHTLSVVARDVAGNESASAPVTAIVDNTGPAVAITSPGAGAQVFGNVSVTATAADALSGVVSVDLLLDGVVQSTVTSSPYVWIWNSSSYSGTHALSAVARDSYGNQTTSAAVSVSIPAPGTGLTGAYYDNSDFTALKLTRVDPAVNFDWQGGTPSTLLKSDTFSVRWTGSVRPRYTETYTFHTISDEGIRVWVNNQQIINNWTGHSAVENSGSIALIAGQLYSVTIEYFEKNGNAVAKFSWSSASQPKEIVPTSQLYPTGS